MDSFKLLVAGLNFTREETPGAGLYRFVVDRSLVMLSAESFSREWPWDQWWTNILQWLSRPDVIAVITAWWITFTVVVTIVLSLGFGPGGVVAGSFAAAFQSFMYGGFTPAGGIFATLTSMAMLGTVMLPAVLLASCVATGVGVVVWKLGIGK